MPTCYPTILSSLGSCLYLAVRRLTYSLGNVIRARPCNKNLVISTYSWHFIPHMDVYALYQRMWNQRTIAVQEGRTILSGWEWPILPQVWLYADHEDCCKGLTQEYASRHQRKILLRWQDELGSKIKREMASQSTQLWK